MTNEEAANELKCYHREDGTVPEEIILAIKALREVDDLREALKESDRLLDEEWGIEDD